MNTMLTFQISCLFGMAIGTLALLAFIALTETESYQEWVQRFRRQWTVSVHADGGEPKPARYLKRRYREVSRKESFRVYADRKDGHEILVRSYVSPEHASEMAVEQRRLFRTGEAPYDRRIGAMVTPPRSATP